MDDEHPPGPVKRAFPGAGPEVRGGCCVPRADGEVALARRDRRPFLGVRVGCLAVCLLACLPALMAGTGTPAETIQELYRAISFPPGGRPDFRALEGLFLPGACLVLMEGGRFRTRNPGEFVSDYRASHARRHRLALGFEERVISSEVHDWGDVAVVRVAYEARLPGCPDPVKRGVDHVSLVRRQARWWVASLVSELERPGRPAAAPAVR